MDSGPPFIRGLCICLSVWLFLLSISFQSLMSLRCMTHGRTRGRTGRAALICDVRKMKPGCLRALPFPLSSCHTTNARHAGNPTHTHITHIMCMCMRTCATARPCRLARGGGMTSKKQVTRGSLPVRGRPSPTSTIGRALVLNCRGSHPRPTIPSTNVHPERTRITPPSGG